MKGIVINMNNYTFYEPTLYIRPPAPPPNIIPKYCPCLKGTGANFIRQHLKLYIYVWTTHKEAFWMYPVRIRGNILLGYVWKSSVWKCAQINISQIDCIF